MYSDSFCEFWNEDYRLFKVDFIHIISAILAIIIKCVYLWNTHLRMRRCNKQMFYMFELENKVIKQIYEELNMKLVCNVCYITFI